MLVDCWSCFVQFEVEEQIDHAVLAEGNCPNCGAHARRHFIRPAAGYEYLAVVGSTMAAVKERPQVWDWLDKHVSENTVLVTGAHRGVDVYVVEWALERSTTVLAVVPGTLRRARYASYLGPLKRLPKIHLIEHPEWERKNHPIYFATGGDQPDFLAPEIMADREIVAAAGRVAVFEFNTTRPYVVEAAQGRPLEIIVLAGEKPARGELIVTTGAAGFDDVPVKFYAGAEAPDGWTPAPLLGEADYLRKFLENGGGTADYVDKIRARAERVLGEIKKQLEAGQNVVLAFDWNTSGSHKRLVRRAIA